MTPVTQADRDAAYPFRGMVMAVDCGPERWNAGEFDDTPLIQAFASHRATPSQRLDAATVEREALAERIRAAVTYQYMPMAVRKLLSEAAAALATEPHQHGGKGA